MQSAIASWPWHPPPAPCHVRNRDGGGIDAANPSLAVRMDDGGAVRTLAGEEIAAHRVAHAFAITVHRSQGSTVDRAHVLEDGGAGSWPTSR